MYHRRWARLLRGTMDEQAGETTMGTNTKNVLTDATAHRNLIDEIWREARAGVVHRPSVWLANIAANRSK